MPLHGDLGLSGPAVLVLLLLGPAFALVVRRRWRLAAARQAEVRRLVRLAAEETARAEMEAMVAYSAASAAAAAATATATSTASVATIAKDTSAWPECPVCFSPATARCARCKAVRYCSGKCQIIHWRQGHKDECHPPPVSDHHGGESNISGLEVEQADCSGLPKRDLEHKEELSTKAAEAFSKRPAASDPTFSSSGFNREDKHEESNSMNVSGKESTSGSLEHSLGSTSGSLVPGHSTFSHSVGTPDEALSSDKLLPIHDDRVGESSSFDIPTNSLRTAVNTSYENPTNPATPELAISNSPTNNACCSSDIKKASASETEADESRLRGLSGSKATSSLDHTNTEHSEVASEGEVTPLRVSNGIHLRTSSKSENSYASASLEAKSQSEHKEALTSNMKTSGPVANGTNTQLQSLKSRTLGSLASVSDQLLSNGGAHPVVLYKYSKVGNAPKKPNGAPATFDSLQNGMSTSDTRVVKEVTSKISRHYSSELMLFPYDRFIKLYNSDKIELRPCGLINCGNSCYANVVLQCLTFTRPLTAYLLEGLHSRICPKKEWCFTCEFESLVMLVKNGRSPLSPIGILSHLHNIGSNFGHGQEEDAHEFLRYAIDCMQSACLKEARKKPDGLLADETTLIQQIFGGYLRSKIRCSRCKGKSERCERMMDVTVEIDGNIATLDEALLRFTSIEILDGENKYECDRCKSYERAKKRLTILEAPNVLTIVLKRFQSGKFGKLNKDVRFPEYLNLAPYMSGDDKSPVYRLYAVIVHIDVMNASFSGHYVCYVKDTQGKWYETNDSEVKPMELDKVLSKGAYMLLYARCSPRAPSSVRKAMAQDLPHAKKPRSKEIKGKPGGSSVAHYLYPPRIIGDQSSSHSSDMLSERLRLPLIDSSSDSSSLFDEGSSCSTESTRDSTSFEEYWEHMSGESDSINLNSPLRIFEDSDGFAHSPRGSVRSSKAVLNGSLPDLPSSNDSGSNASCSGRETDQVEAERYDRIKHDSNGNPSSLYSDEREHCINSTEHTRTLVTDWISPNNVKSGILLRRPTSERTAQTFY
ncbi:ubiquitin carboxyl-terminal hydrolase 16-like [Musa acuminata AAA Group]|uniref:ubiquitin carboxyl-terminal hydrolase 16-like n=1 Tax=Musa acuminata AAA Group TaxID=214697 RepID=UPI0031D97ECF